MRADAARRRTAILREARRLFAAVGSDVALEAVADAVALATFEDMAAAADAALKEIAEHPDEAWSRYVRRLVDLDLGAATAALAEHAGRELTAPVREAQDRTLAGVEQVLAA